MHKIIIPCGGIYYVGGAHINNPKFKVLHGEPEDRRGEEDLVPSEEISKQAFNLDRAIHCLRIRKSEPGEDIELTDKEWLYKSAGLRYMAGKTPGEKVGLFILLPKELAKQYPPEGKAGEDDSDPHVTLLYVGDVPNNKFDDLEQIVREELTRMGPFEVELLPPDTFVNDEDQTILHSPVKGDILEPLSGIIKERLIDEGFEFKHPDRPFKGHVTIEYVDPGEEPQFSDVMPMGSWLVNEIEIWGLGDPRIIKLDDSGDEQLEKKVAEQFNKWSQIHRLPDGSGFFTGLVGGDKKSDVFDPRINRKTKSDYVGPQSRQVGDIGGVAADTSDNYYEDETGKYEVSKLIESSDNLPIVSVNVQSVAEHPDNKQGIDELLSTLVNDQQELQRTQNVDLSAPILIKSDHIIVDGFHRVVRAILDKQFTIPAKIVTPEILSQSKIAQKNPNYLFVYGALRRGEPYYEKFLADSKFVKTVKTQPKYHLVITQAAGMVPGESAVEGELYEVPDHVMAEIDQYEHPYYRQEIELDDGTKANAYFVPEEVADIVEEAPRMSEGSDVESSVFPGAQDNENLRTDPVETDQNRDILREHDTERAKYRNV